MSVLALSLLCNKCVYGKMESLYCESRLNLNSIVKYTIGSIELLLGNSHDAFAITDKGAP